MHDEQIVLEKVKNSIPTINVYSSFDMKVSGEQ
jgi:hypothetical protein